MNERLPFGVGAELRPVLRSGFAAGVRHDINQRGLRPLILRYPIAHAFYAVPVEDGDGVIAKAGLECRQLAFVTGVSAELVHAGLGKGESGAERQQQDQIAGHEDSVPLRARPAHLRLY